MQLMPPIFPQVSLELPLARRKLWLQTYRVHLMVAAANSSEADDQLRGIDGRDVCDQLRDLGGTNTG